MKRFLFLPFIFFIVVQCIGQAKFNGYIILENGDTVKGSILLIQEDGEVDYSTLDKEIQFGDSAWNIRTYTANKKNRIIGYGMQSNNDKAGDYVALFYNDKNRFFRRTINGFWKVYEQKVSYNTGGGYSGPGMPRSSAGGYEVLEHYIIFNDQLVLLERKSKFFKLTEQELKLKQLKEVFADYPDILNKLTDEMSFDELKKILEEYNKLKTG